MRTKFRNKILFGVTTLLLVSAAYAAGSEAWYRRIDVDAYERLVGVSSIDFTEAAETNAYRFSYDASGRLVEVEYHRSGRTLSDPVYGVQRIEISYESGYVYRRFTDSRGAPVPDERGIWSQRIRLDESGRAIGVFHYDQFDNIIADKDGVALRLWDLDKLGRRSNLRFLD
jgi:YD repeat-containing protein